MSEISESWRKSLRKKMKLESTSEALVVDINIWEERTSWTKTFWGETGRSLVIVSWPGGSHGRVLHEEWVTARAELVRSERRDCEEPLRRPLQPLKACSCWYLTLVLGEALLYRWNVILSFHLLSLPEYCFPKCFTQAVNRCYLKNGLWFINTGLNES